MTKLLEQAFSEASHLSDIEQNAVAKWMLAELAAEKRWERSFAASEATLDVLADEALSARNAGKTKKLDLGSL
jgi:hypothetical protein